MCCRGVGGGGGRGFAWVYCRCPRRNGTSHKGRRDLIHSGSPMTCTYCSALVSRCMQTVCLGYSREGGVCHWETADTLLLHVRSSCTHGSRPISGSDHHPRRGRRGHSDGWPVSQPTGSLSLLACVQEGSICMPNWMPLPALQHLRPRSLSLGPCAAQWLPWYAYT